MKKELQAVEKIENNNKGMKKLAALAAVAAASSAFASGGSDPFATMKGFFVKWLSGDLGKIMVLLGFVGTFIIYLMTHKGSVLVIGIIIVVIGGGLIGIVDKFWQAGQSSFTSGTSF